MVGTQIWQLLFLWLLIRLEIFKWALSLTLVGLSVLAPFSGEYHITQIHVGTAGPKLTPSWSELGQLIWTRVGIWSGRLESLSSGIWNWETTLRLAAKDIYTAIFYHMKQRKEWSQEEFILTLLLALFCPPILATPCLGVPEDNHIIFCLRSFKLFSAACFL